MKKRRLDTEGCQSGVPSAWVADVLSRRAFLLRGSTALAVSCAFPSLPLVRGEEFDPESALSSFSDKQAKILSAVQEHLFPNDADSPGALEINALPFLGFVITRPDFATTSRNFIINGIQSLQEASMERFDSGFETLDVAGKESLLRYLADRTRWGRNWLSLLLYYIFEALLADPVYGCNPDGIGWKWLEHQPGFPRPPPDKIYTRL
jgi:gluconate 2-dehydrogenase gamma chain